MTITEKGKLGRIRMPIRFPMAFYSGGGRALLKTGYMKPMRRSPIAQFLSLWFAPKSRHVCFRSKAEPIDAGDTSVRYFVDFTTGKLDSSAPAVSSAAPGESGR